MNTQKLRFMVMISKETLERDPMAVGRQNIDWVLPLSSKEKESSALASANRLIRIGEVVSERQLLSPPQTQ